jgi:phenylpropionate dioxygenase-like ring-hydroxylating dioxygenase large terminal subunit
MNKPNLGNHEVMDGGTSANLRGDAITGDRYYSRDFMEREWDRMWTRVWHIGARCTQLAEAGDYVVHDFRHESVLLVRDADNRYRAFYNVCQHRGNRLVWSEEGSVPSFTCAYHGWVYGLDGSLQYAQDPDDFAGGDPCGDVKLVELPCDSWGGFVWYSMDENAKPLLDYLHPIPQLLANREVEKMTRVVWRKVDVQTNWKFASDNFNESYHLPTVHPQMKANIEEDYANTVFEMYPSGHNRMIEKGQPSQRSDLFTPDALWADFLAAWGMDAGEWAGKPAEARLELQRKKRELGKGRGHHYMAKLADDELSDYFHHTIFPNLTITGTPIDGGMHVFRTEPHPTDPERCTFEYWALTPHIEGATEVPTVTGMRPIEEAELEELTYGVDPVGDFVDQDLSVAVWQQKGLHSRGYRDARLSEQESRVRRFHEVLNDYLEGRR